MDFLRNPLGKNYRDSAQRGFTIVELLVVIVVIGILAAIIIVAYNGLQDRAQTTKTVSTATSYEKILKLYKAENDTYPSIDYGDNSCLGTEADYPVTDTFELG